MAISEILIVLQVELSITKCIIMTARCVSYWCKVGVLTDCAPVLFDDFLR